MESTAGKHRIFKFLLAVPLTFHLAAVTLNPTIQSIPVPFVNKVVTSYVTALEMVCPWRFFAPDPGPPPAYVEWDMIGKKGETLSAGRFPSVEDEKRFFSEGLMRKLASARFMIQQDGRLDKMMLPVICKQHPEARGVRFRSAAYPQLTFDEAVTGTRTLASETNRVEHKDLGYSFCESVQ